MIMENLDYGSATNRQRWALFCITKQDYRQVVISKEEASELIAQYKSSGTPYEKGKNKPNKPQKESRYKEVSSEELREEFTKIWGKDARMVEHCVKSKSLAIRLSNGRVICMDKPYIDTEFWIGYSDCGQGLSYDEANRTQSNIIANMEKYFIEKNMHRCNVLLEKIKNTDNKVYIAKQYDGKSESNFVNFYFFENEWGNEYERLKRFGVDFQEVTDKGDIDLIKWAIKEYCQRFEKRLQTYLKRFGTSKLRCSTYWLDR